MAQAPKTLAELRDYLKEGVIWDGAPMKGAEIDDQELPLFGGDEPKDTAGVWSWDEKSVLAGLCLSEAIIRPR